MWFENDGRHWLHRLTRKKRMSEYQNIRTHLFTRVYSLSIIFIYWVMTAALLFALSILLPSGWGRLFDTDWRQICWMTIDAGPLTGWHLRSQVQSLTLCVTISNYVKLCFYVPCNHPCKFAWCQCGISFRWPWKPLCTSHVQKDYDNVGEWIKWTCAYAWWLTWLIQIWPCCFPG